MTEFNQPDWRAPYRVTHLQRIRSAWSRIRLALFPARDCATCRFALNHTEWVERNGRGERTRRLCKRFPPVLVAADPHHWESRRMEWTFPPLLGPCGEWKRTPLFGRRPDA